MDEVTYVKTRFRQEQWEKLIQECQSSGLKVDDWCKDVFGTIKAERSGT